MREEFTSHSAEETERLGASLARRLTEGDPSALFFIKLKGPLGAGKTAFTRGVASVLSPESRVKSPTYTIVNEYRSGQAPLFHFDLYRLGEESDLSDIGFDEYVAGGHCIIEWSEYLSCGAPEDALTVTIEPVDEATRRIVIDIPDKE